MDDWDGIVGHFTDERGLAICGMSWNEAMRDANEHGTTHQAAVDRAGVTCIGCLAMMPPPSRESAAVEEWLDA